MSGDLSSYFDSPPRSPADHTNCQQLNTFLPDIFSWKCPSCQGKVDARAGIQPDGNRKCARRSCQANFHWCPIYEKEVIESPIHKGDYSVDYFNCKIQYGMKLPDESSWRCPKCKGKPELNFRPLDGGSLSCQDCPHCFHWCPLEQKEVEGPPLHCKVKERQGAIKKKKVEDYLIPLPEKSKVKVNRSKNNLF